MHSQIEIFAPIRGPEGYSILSRDLIVQLSKKGYHVCLHEFKHWGPFEVCLTHEEHFYLGSALKNKPVPSKEPRPFLNICLPEQVTWQEPVKNYLYTMFETSGIPENWVSPLNSMDTVIVPTYFNHQTFSSSGVSQKIEILPIGFDSDRYKPGNSRFVTDVDFSKFAHKFLAICEVTNRKNFWGMIQTFCQVTDVVGFEKCCLILRAGNYSKQISLIHEIRDFIRSLYDQGVVRHPIYSIFNYPVLIPNESHVDFIRLADYYLSTSLGEGWDLTAMQAGACGLPLFVPHHTAYQCWLPKGLANFLPIVKKIPAAQEGQTGVFYAGQDWYAFDLPASIDIIAGQLLYNRDYLKKQASDLSQYLRNTYAWDDILPQYERVLELC